MSHAETRHISLTQPVQSYFVPVAISVVLHGLLIIAVVWGWESSPEPNQRVMPRYVEAKLVTMKPKAKKPAAKKKQTKTIDLAAKRRAEEKRKAQARQAALKKQQAAEALKAKQEAERLAKEKLAQEKLLEEQKQEQERQRLQEEAFAEALAAEDDFLLAEQDEVTAQSYVSLIAQAIEQRWSRPPSARKGMKCELQLTLIPTGEVVNVAVTKSSGHAAFDRSAEQAVKRVGRFEALQDVPPAVFEKYFRQLTLVFNPQDLRL